jgi:hypothetical protein
MVKVQSYSRISANWSRISFSRAPYLEGRQALLLPRLEHVQRQEVDGDACGTFIHLGPGAQGLIEGRAGRSGAAMDGLRRSPRLTAGGVVQSEVAVAEENLGHGEHAAQLLQVALHLPVAYDGPLAAGDAAAADADAVQQQLGADLLYGLLVMRA